MKSTSLSLLNIAVAIHLVVAFTCDVGLSNASDRSLFYLPQRVQADPNELPTAENIHAMVQSGITPDDAVGDSAVWSRYIALWKSHHDDPSDRDIRHFLSLPRDEEVLVSSRAGRASPRFLPWRPGSFQLYQTPHFEILSRASEADSRKVARDVERLYWVWTQMYFPLWSSRDQVALVLEPWQPDEMKVSRYLNQSQRVGRLTPRTRHRIVLLPDAKTYQMTIASPGVSAGSTSNIIASAGFYSDSLQTAFFYAGGSDSVLAHETCHQLFEEATDRRRIGRSFVGSSVSDSESFWLIEGVAGHFESIRFSGSVATIGGWDSSRLQYARYQTLVAGAPIAVPAELSGNASTIQKGQGLATWYTHAILLTHFAMDYSAEDRSPDGAPFPLRTTLLAKLAEIYHIRLNEPFSANPDLEIDPNSVRNFLSIDDDQMRMNPITNQPTELCLAACDVSDSGWSSLPPLPNLRWFDASRTGIDDAQTRRLIVAPQHLQQLSLEATRVSTAVSDLLSKTTELRELDLSWTTINDSVIAEIASRQSLETLWLTGTKITDAVIDSLIRLPALTTVDVQRTSITPEGLSRLRNARSQLDLNPLRLVTKN